jgi:lysozyme family protein
MTNRTKIKNIQRTLNEDPDGADLKVDGVIGPKTEAAFYALKAEEDKHSSLGSWYSQYKGKYTWVDTGDKPNSNALGVPDDQQGIALPTSKTLGDWFFVTAPNGKTLKLQQTDIGPADWTGRTIDIAAVAAERFGYSPKTFPTDEGLFYWKPA